MKRSTMIALALAAGLASSAAAQADNHIAKSSETFYSVSVASAQAYAGFTPTLVDVTASALDDRKIFCIQNATTTAGVNLWCANRAQDAVVGQGIAIEPLKWHCPNTPVKVAGVRSVFYCRNDSANSAVYAAVVQKD